MTPLYPAFEKRIDDAVAKILNQQVEPWFFMRQQLSLQRFDGRPIAYQGVEFEGSPRTVFWAGYIEPFLQDLIVKELPAATAEAKEREVDGRLLITEVQGLLLSACQRVFARMVEVDQRLRGHGYPHSVSRRSVERELSEMRLFLDRHAHAELQMWKERPAYERWYERNKFWVWALGLVVAIAGLATRFL